MRRGAGVKGRCWRFESWKVKLFDSKQAPLRQPFSRAHNSMSNDERIRKHVLIATLMWGAGYVSRASARFASKNSYFIYRPPYPVDEDKDGTILHPAFYVHASLKYMFVFAARKSTADA